MTHRLSDPFKEKLIKKGWGVYIMNMITKLEGDMVFRKDNEKGYQPYFGSTGNLFNFFKLSMKFIIILLLNSKIKFERFFFT